MDISTRAMSMEMRIRFHGAMMSMALASCRKLLEHNRRPMVEVAAAVNAMAQLVETDHQNGIIVGVSENQYLIDIKADDLRRSWKDLLERNPKFPGSTAISTRVKEALAEAAGLSDAIKDLQQETCRSK